MEAREAQVGETRVVEGRNIICFASNWFYDPTSKHHVMKVLAERNHVIWVNYHGSRRPRATAADAGSAARKIRQVVQGPRRVAENMTVITPLVVPLPGNRVAEALNRRLVVRQIRRVLRGLPSRTAEVWSFAPDVDYVRGRFGEECVVYYCVDEFSEFSGYDRERTLAAEARLAGHADLVVTTSQALYEAKRRLNPNTVLVPHGVDFEHFSRATSEDTVVPAEISSLPRPVLGFWGLIQDWFDVELVAAVARSRPQWSVVLVGETATDIAAFEGLANVHLLGRRRYELLPAYAKGFDVGLIPFRVNELTRAVNPIKLREYLSAGLAVVSTPLPEVANYGGLVSIAGDAAGFVTACEEFLAAGPDRDARQAAMRGETWRGKVEAVCEQVLRCVEKRGKSARRQER